MTSYLNSTFWNDNPNDYDIITALYGTGDEGSIYTKNWSGYNSDSCLNSGITVIHTGLIPTTIEPNTIYVIYSWTYTISSTIEMAECSVLTTSGHVTIKKTSDFDAISMSGIHYSIIDHIKVDGDMYNGNGFSIYSGWSNTMHSIISTNNGNDGINISQITNLKIHTANIYNNTNYGLYVWITMNSTFTDINSYNNSQDSIFLSQVSNSTFTNITWGNSMVGRWIHVGSSWNNTFDRLFVFGNKLDGIVIHDSHYNTWTNITVYANGWTYHGWGIKIIAWSTNNILTNVEIYNNTLFGLNLNTSSYNTFQNFHIYQNGTYGIDIENGSDHNNFSWFNNHENSYHGFYMSSSNFNVFTGLESYNHTNHNIFLDNANNNNFNNTVANQSTSKMWLYMTNSSNNTFNNLSAYGNYYAWLHLYNSENNSFTNIIANSNEGGLYLSNSSGNDFNNLTVNNNGTWNGIVFLDSDYNILSGLFSTGNMWWGIYWQASHNNIFSNSSVYGNFLWGILSVSGNNNIFRHIEAYANTWRSVSIAYASGTILDSINIHNNSENSMSGLSLWYSMFSIITNSTITNNANWITIAYGHNNIISWCSLSWNTYDGIHLYSTSKNIIKNSHDYYSWSWLYHNSINTVWWTWNNFLLFSWSHRIIGQIYSWFYDSDIENYGYVFDTYTLNNNYIEFLFSPYARLTGNTISVWNQFYLDFDKLTLGYNSNEILFSWTASFTISGASRDGRLYAPTKITTGIKLWTIGETWMSMLTSILDTIEVVSGSTYLVMSWWISRVNFTVLSWTSGQRLTIMKSINGSIWTVNTPDNSCVLDSSFACKFTTNGNIKLFAFWIPTNYSFSWVTQTGGTVISWWYYSTWVIIYFTGDNLSGATINGVVYTGGSLITADGHYMFVLTDIWGNSTGMSFTIDTTNPIVTGNYPTSWMIINGTTTINFMRSGIDNNMSWYTLYIGSTGYSIGNTNTYSIYLPNWSYTWYVVATDAAWNTGMSQQIPFTIITPLLPSITLSTGNLVYNAWWYTKDYVSIILTTNKLANYIFTGDFTTTPIVGTWLNGTMTGNFYLSGLDGSKKIYFEATDGITTTWTTFTVILDTTVPTITLYNPSSGSVVSWAFMLLWSAAGTDAVGISGYRYYLSTTGTFTTVVKSGFTTNTWVSIANGELANTTYYRYVSAIDKLNNSWASAIWSFIYSGGAVDTTPDQFSFNDIEDADLDEIYTSNTITITGMSPWTPVLASVNRWALYISGNFVWTTGYVQNGWTVKIELTSSDEYDETISSTLTINGVSDTFSITTIGENEAIDSDYEDIETDLSNTEKLMIISIFETLRDLYSWDKEKEFFNTLMVILEDKMDDYTENNDQWNTLKYLYDIINQYYDQGNFGDNIDTTRWIVNGVYTAPNGKKYTIKYDSTKQWFTSTNFVVPKYFPTLDTLKYIIDINNPVGSSYANAKPILARWKNTAIDGTWQTSPYTAPNKKVFYFFKDINGRYSSYTFTSEKWFDSLNDMKEFIYTNNKK